MVARDHSIGTTVTAAADVVTIGETMGCFLLRGNGSLEGPIAIGAESNVAQAVAGFGHAARWVSRLGTDMLGDLVAAQVAASGVDVVAQRDPDRPTGLAIKELGEVTTVRYYRRGSAAAELGSVDVPNLEGAAWLHLSGITPAIAAASDALFRTAFERAARAGTRVSLDINLRPALWPDLDVARRQLLSWCRAADLVLVGEDEARALDLGDDLDELAANLAPRPETTIVRKLGRAGAEALQGSQRAYVPAVAADVVDVVGAGDALAAGVLIGSLRRLSLAAQLRLGVGFAARVVQVSADVAPTPDSVTRASLLSFANEAPS
jgi:2-dehydro-3-deoxygluconokinase